MTESRLSELLGIPEIVLGGALVGAWVFALVISAYRYRVGNYTKAEYYSWSGGSLMWIAFGLTRVTGSLTGSVGLILDLVSFTAAIIAIGMFIRWWQVRDSR